MFTKKRFSLRKLKAYGVASVTVGVALLGTQATTVEAAKVPTAGPIIGTLDTTGDKLFVSQWDSGFEIWGWEDDGYGDPYFHMYQYSIDPTDGSIIKDGVDTNVIPPLQRAQTDFIFHTSAHTMEYSKFDTGLSGTNLLDITLDIERAKDNGWELISNDRPENAVLDDDTSTDQYYQLIFKRIPQKAIVNFIDESDPNNPLAVEQLSAEPSTLDIHSYDPDLPFNYDHSTKLNEFLSQGYELVSNDYPGTDSTFSRDVQDTEIFNIVLRKKPKYSVTVKFQLTDGSQLSPDVLHANDLASSTAYDTTIHNQQKVSKNDKAYRLVRVDGTEKDVIVDSNITVTYVYEEVFTTNWVDTSNTPLKVPVTDVSTFPSGTIDNYQFIESKTDHFGNVTHIFGQILATIWVDVDGNELKTPIKNVSTSPAGSIDGYTLVESKTDVNGNVSHVFKKNSVVVNNSNSSSSNSSSSNSNSSNKQTTTNKTNAEKEKMLPHTGEHSQILTTLFGSLLVLVGLIVRKKRQ